MERGRCLHRFTKAGKGTGQARCLQGKTPRNKGRQRPGVHFGELPTVVQGKEYRDKVHPTGQAGAEQPCRTLQQELSARGAQRLPVRIPFTSKDTDRTVGGALQ